PSFAGKLSNTAKASPSEPGNPPVVTPPAETDVTQKPVIVLSKTGPASAVAGSEISYVIEASNTGLSNAANLVISDVVPATLSNVSWTASVSGSSVINSGANGSGNTITINGNIPAGAGNKISITVKGTINPSFAGKLSNIATATPSEPGNPAVVTPPAETNVTQKPVIGITKTAPSTAVAGAEMTYVIEAVNTGLSNATGLVITDAVPAQLGNVSWTSSITGTAVVTAGASGTGNTLSVTGNIPAGTGNKITITIKGTVAPSFVGKLSNIATATPSEPGNPPVVTPPAETEVGSVPGVVIRKTGPATAVSGTEISYVIEAGNTGLSNAVGLTISDAVPATLSNVSWSSSATGSAVVSSGGTGTGNTISLKGNIPAGAGNTILVTVRGTISAAFNGNLSNTATATPAEPGTSAVSSTSTAVVSKTPVLSMQKTGPSAISAGQAITYSLIVSNTGTSNADNASISDIVPVNVNNVSWTAVAEGGSSVLTGASGTGNNITVTGNIPAGAGNVIRVTVNGTVNAAATGDIENTATVTPSEAGTVPSSSKVTTTVSSSPSVTLVKSGPSVISAGQRVTYTVTAGNNGPSNANNLSISDAVPAGLTGVSWTAVPEGNAAVTTGSSGTGNSVMVKGNIAAGAGNRIVITISGDVPSSGLPGTLSNTAVATPSEPGIPPVNSNTVTTTIDNKVNIRAVKSAPSSVSAGSQLTYSLQVFNDGPTDAKNLDISDALPSGLINVSWSTSVSGSAAVVANGSGTGSSVNLKVNIPAGAANSVTVTINGTVDAGFSGSSLSNQFTATPTEPGNPAVVSNTVTTTVNRTADIQVQKTGPQSIVAGQPISYTISVSNAGPSNAGVVNISDVLPAGLTNVSWTAVGTNGAVLSGASSGTGNVSVTANIPAGSALVQITVNGTVDAGFAGSSLVNTATAVPGAGVTDPSPASSTVT
ncbi:beta strand repeat-containing protein, partial [Pedobacter frigoris]